MQFFLKRRHSFTLTLVVVVVVVVLCNFTKGDKGIPFQFKVPKAYSVRIEETEYGKVSSEKSVKYFDHDVRKMSLWSSDKDQVFVSLFDFIHNMYVKVEMMLKTTDSVCDVVYNLKASPMRFESDFSLKKGGAIDIASPNASLLMSGDYDYVPLGSTTIRGIDCNTWSTQKRIDSDEVVTANVSFTDSNTWKTVSQLPQVLVRLSLESNTIPKTIIEYSDFNPVIYVDSNNNNDNMGKFQPPPGVACERQAANIPILPKVFKLKTEVLMRNNHETTYMEELYDFETKRVKFVFYSPANEIMTEVQDFLTGVSYKIETSGVCTIQLMSDAEPDVHISTIKGVQSVKMDNSQYFYVFNSTKFMYEGQRLTRGIVCDVWTVTGDISGLETTWRYFFATEDASEVGSDNGKRSWLIMYEMMIPNSKVHAIYNVYEYSEREPDIWDFNIATCFPAIEQKQISFKVPVSLSDLISTNEKRFTNAVISTIQGHSGLSALRITNIQIDYLKDSIYVTATLLDKAPVNHQNKEPYVEPGLQKAVKDTIDALKYNAFVITLLDLKNNPHRFTGTLAERPTTTPPPPTTTPTPTPSSSVRPGNTTGSSQHPVTSASNDAGKMVGLAIGMLLTGILLSTISFILYRRLVPKTDNRGLLVNENL